MVVILMVVHCRGGVVGIVVVVVLVTGARAEPHTLENFVTHQSKKIS